MPHQAARLRKLTDLVRAWSSCERVEQFLVQIARAAVEVTGARRAVALLTSLVSDFQTASYVDPADPGAGEPPRFHAGLVEVVVLSGRSVYAREITASQLIQSAPTSVQIERTAATCIPLDAGRRQIGVLYIEHPTPPRSFDDSDLELLEMIALHGAIAIENLNNLTRAITDPLTRVYTHRHFMMLVDHELRQSRREGISNALLLLDLDHFKRINDSLGHSAGNEFIVQYADFLRAHVRSSDVIGRFGGDEFEILLPNTGQAGAEVFAAKIQEALRKVRWRSRRRVTNSIGIAIFTDHADQAEMLFQKADEALYEAKARGRNRIAMAYQKAEPGQSVDWSLDGGRSVDLARLRRLRRRAAQAESDADAAATTPALPFPGLAVAQLFETDGALTKADIVAATTLSLVEVTRVLRQLQATGKIERRWRGAVATWRRSS